MTIKCSLGEFAAHLLTAEADMRLAQEAILEKACRMVEETAKDAIGSYVFDWPRLEPETIARKRYGDTPLLETGKLRDSIEHFVDMSEPAGYVGSNEKIAVYQELGTSRIPPRSFLGSAARAREDEIHDMAGRIMAGVIMRGGPLYHEFRVIMEALKKAWHSTKELGEELLNNDERER